MKQISGIKLLIVKLFGKRVNGVEKPTKTDKGSELTGYHYNKVLYVTNFSETKWHKHEDGVWHKQNQLGEPCQA